MKSKKEILHYEDISRNVRKVILEMIYTTNSSHIGSSFSIVEILISLYFKIMKVSPEDTINPDRDRFILSKGHGCSALYAVLFKRGFMSKNDIEGFAVNGGILELHPRMELKYGIEISTGSLGHGLSIGSGMALAGMVDNRRYKVYVLLSDGELNEGSTWESIMFAGSCRMSNIVALVDYNKIQALGVTSDIVNIEPLGDKWRSFGWYVQEIDGHSFEQIFKALSSLSPERPNVIILNTVKGKGVSFMENKVSWHYNAPNDTEYKIALEELSK